MKRANRILYSASRCCTESKFQDVDFLMESLHKLRSREQNYLIQDYLNNDKRQQINADTQSLPFPKCSEPVDMECRTKMCEWCLQIVDHCGFQQETAAMSINYLDRFLQSTPWSLLDRSAFQLAAITSLYTAIKLHEPQAIAIETMVSLSRNVYSKEQIAAMERLMLDANQWLTHSPTAFTFANYFCQLVEHHDERFEFGTVLDLATLQIESSLLDYELSQVPPSSVAFAAVMNAIDGMGLSNEEELYPIGQYLATMAKIDVYSSQIASAQIRLYESIVGTDHESDLKSFRIAKNSKHQSSFGSQQPVSPRSIAKLSTLQQHSH